MTISMQGSVDRCAVEADARPQLEKGTGLNSIPLRFALLTITLLVISGAVLIFSVRQHATGELGLATLVGIAGACILLPTWMIYFAGTKLAYNIQLLKENTEAILAGALDRPIEVDCSCEVGGLADSFRAMIGKINANILRMNVLAYTDQITGLPNRAVVTHALALFEDTEATVPCALLFLDLDGFKSVNDMYGHSVGDQLLRLVTDRIVREGLGLALEDIDGCMTPSGELCSALPTRPIVARFAGDEFVVVLPGVDKRTELGRIAQSLLAAISRPYLLNGHEIRVGVTVGVACYPADTNMPTRLNVYADVAMYAGKASGKGQITFFQPSHNEAIARRTQIEVDLRKAIEDGMGLALHYQPKINTTTLGLAGVEALVRWEHPKWGAISPAEFIPVAEQTGLINALGEKVIAMALDQWQVWQDEGTACPVAINVSPCQFGHADFTTELTRKMREAGVPADQLIVEITESALMSDAVCVSKLAALRAAGVRLSIDDFGTGYSNLARLAHLPIDELKLDRTLLMDLADSPKTQAFIKAFVEAGKAIGLRIVAEGVETLEQRLILRRLGCDEMQGFLFAKPMSASQLAVWKAQRSIQPLADMHDRICAPAG